MRANILGLACAAGLVSCTAAQEPFETDTLATPAGELKMTFIGHGTLMFQFKGQTVHIDPWEKLAEYDRLPKADLILITHEHGDHLDPAAIGKIRTAQTVVIATPLAAAKLGGGTVMTNGAVRRVGEIGIEAVPAYNIVHERAPGQPFHPRGGGNGYVLTFGDKRVYVAGDTENTPEMNALKNIDVAFLPMNLPYTMTPAMVADAARAFRPSILYPYHYGETDVAALRDLLKDVPGIDVRIRRLK